jgi:nucleoside-diphosphate-sugar epimerase
MTYSWAGSRVLITGGNGFIGSNLVRRLVDCGASVSVVVRPGSDLWRLRGMESHLRVYWADVTDAVAVLRIVSELRPDVVFHTAVKGGHPRSAGESAVILHTSVFGTFSILEACLQAGVPRIVHLGGSTEYRTSAEAMDETVPLEPDTFRGVAKALASHLVAYYARSRGLPVCILRPFSVYGPWESMERFIPRLLVAALTGEELALAGPGFRHDFVFVGDLVEAMLRAGLASLAPGQILNIGSGEEYTNEEMVDTVSRLVGRPVKVKLGAHPPSPTDRPHWRADASLAKRLLGWQPRYGLAEGLAVHLRWMRDYLEI